MFEDPKIKAQAELDAMLQEIAPPQDPAPSDTGTPAAPASAPAPAQTPEPAPTTAPQPPPTPAPAPVEDPWKHRFETLQGKYQAEVPRLHAEIRQLRSDIETLRTAPRPQPPAPVTPIEETADFKALVEEYGEKAAKAMVGMTQSVAQRTSETTVRQHVEPVAQSVQSVSHSVEEQGRVSLHTQIAQQAGADWELVNSTPEFTAWTFAHVDRLSGETYNALLNQAYRSGDASRVAVFFNDYKASLAPPPQPQPSPTPAPAPVSGQAAMVAPPRRSTSTQDATDTQPGRVWAQSEIDGFYKDWTNGKYRGREAEAKAIEADVMKAVLENRVVG